MEKLKTVSRIDIFNNYRLRLRLRKEKGLSVDGWDETLKNIESCQLDKIKIGKFYMTEKKCAILFIGGDEILGCVILEGYVPNG